MKKAYVAGFAMIGAFLVLGLASFRSTITPYVSFAEAQKASRTVQVMGVPDKASTKYDTATKTLLFTLVEENGTARLPVAYTDVKPANFEDALTIVAIGRYAGGRFEADKLLVKCPSKYQGEEVNKQYGSKT